MSPFTVLTKNVPTRTKAKNKAKHGSLRVLKAPVQEPPPFSTKAGKEPKTMTELVLHCVNRHLAGIAESGKSKLVSKEQR